MTRCYLRRLGVLSVFLLSALWLQVADAAAASPGLTKAKQEAEAKGFVFETSHDAIIAKAKKEGKLRVITGLETSNKFTAEAFRKKYPFIDLHVENIRGTEQAQRNLLEVKSGAAKDWDMLRPVTDFYSEYLPYLWKVDVLGMAEQGVLTIPPAMIDPNNRNVVGLVSRFQVSAYNKTLLPPRSGSKDMGRYSKAPVQRQKICCRYPPAGNCGSRARLGSGKDSRFLAQGSGATTDLDSGRKPNPPGSRKRRGAAFHWAEL